MYLKILATTPFKEAWASSRPKTSTSVPGGRSSLMVLIDGIGRFKNKLEYMIGLMAPVQLPFAIDAAVEMLALNTLEPGPSDDLLAEAAVREEVLHVSSLQLGEADGWKILVSVHPWHIGESSVPGEVVATTRLLVTTMIVLAAFHGAAALRSLDWLAALRAKPAVFAFHCSSAASSLCRSIAVRTASWRLTVASESSSRFPKYTRRPWLIHSGIAAVSTEPVRSQHGDERAPDTSSKKAVDRKDTQLEFGDPDRR
eukprot:CAMPEP_0206439918 /NCGR_PEP_ID=MMETSP0324_2-20121206/12476_1 /ASSEMBLY_ACC=CAM_ASM_000836 /TAXON_ID=2866 /ORGANISM="Crypthecodinium cohnii, Strain Seligo" /LENGTH=255 /DNA_ID=CAMNT_0053907589 /DNA_START=66 /DNA_END=834 /DNA_ORIENTATION=-